MIVSSATFLGCALAALLSWNGLLALAVWFTSAAPHLERALQADRFGSATLAAASTLSLVAILLAMRRQMR